MSKRKSSEAFEKFKKLILMIVEFDNSTKTGIIDMWFYTIIRYEPIKEQTDLSLTLYGHIGKEYEDFAMIRIRVYR